jgi:hypothetical protein
MGLLDGPYRSSTLPFLKPMPLELQGIEVLTDDSHALFWDTIGGFDLSKKLMPDYIYNNSLEPCVLKKI